MSLPENIAKADNRHEWVEPVVQQLDISETAYEPLTGGDGERSYGDCTRS